MNNFKTSTNLISKKHFGLVLIFSFSLLFLNSTQAQFNSAPKNDSIKQWKTKLNPKLSPVLSAAVPGLGQIYNRKIWVVTHCKLFSPDTKHATYTYGHRQKRTR